MTIQYTRNLILDLTEDGLSAYSEAESWGVENLLTNSPQDKYRSTGLSAEYIDIDFGSAVTIDQLAIIEHNLTSGATITLKAADNAAFTSSVDTGVTWREGVIIQTFTALTYRYWRLLITDASNPDGYLEIGILHLGEVTELEAFLPANWSRINMDSSQRHVTPSMKVFIVEGERYQHWEITFSKTNPLYPDDIEKIDDLIDFTGSRKGFLFSIKQGADIYTHTIWCYMADYQAIQQINSANFSTWGLTVEELI